LAAGFDGTVHNYALAEDDTTETISEFMAEVAIEGRSARRARHRWRVRGDFSAGTELYRQRLDADYRLVSDGVTRVRLDGIVLGRQYRRDTEYTYSSDNWEGRLEGRLQPIAWSAAVMELRGFAGGQNYRTPSTLEQDTRKLGVGAYLRSRALDERWWSAGLLAQQRTYPDTSEIDRDQLAIEVSYGARDLEQQGLRFHHRSERREMRDETVRPSAWAHWSDFGGALGAGSGQLVLELQNEFWQYDYETGAWFDSWRLDGMAGYRWGDILSATWTLGVAGERLDAGDNPDSYRQYGLRTGVESYGLNLSGSLQVEYGHRGYDDSAIEIDDEFLEGTVFNLYSNFNYWKIWLMGTWSIDHRLALEAMASFEPESHTEQTDDATFGFVNLRLVWRP